MGTNEGEWQGRIKLAILLRNEWEGIFDGRRLESLRYGRLESLRYESLMQLWENVKADVFSLHYAFVQAAKARAAEPGAGAACGTPANILTRAARRNTGAIKTVGRSSGPSAAASQTSRKRGA